MKLLTERELKELVSSISVEWFNKPFNDRVFFNNRLRTTGGRYMPVKRHIELNPKYYIEGDRETFIGIIKHELCHYHLHIEGRGYKHRDREFRELLQKTNSPRFCTPLPSQQNYRYLYKCRECGASYNRKRRIDTKRFCCGRCRGQLELVEDKG